MADNIIKDCSVVLKPCTPKLRECFVSLQQCTASKSEIKKHNRSSRSGTPTHPTVATVPCTPNTDPALATELRRAITEKNILTTKTKSKLISALNELEKANAEGSRKHKKEKATKEVLDSEIAYLKQLEIIVKYFKEPLKEKYILSENEIEKIFSKITILYNLNRELLNILNENQINIAEAFRKVAPFFKMYSTYAYEYKMISGFLQELINKNDNFVKFLNCQETRPEVNTKLSSLLITPIQRIPRYCLLLKQILLYTLESEPDYGILKDSLQIVEESAKHINSLVADRENSERLLRIQNTLVNHSPQIIKPGRKLLKEGKVLNMTEAAGNVMYLVAMTDILMFCKIKKENLKSKNALKCSTILPLNKCRFTQNVNLRKIHISCDNNDIEILIETAKEFHQWIDTLKESHKNIIMNRYTLRKESSARRPAYKETLISYNEVGLSPGVPQRKRRVSATPPNFPEMTGDTTQNKRKKPPYVTLSKRRCIRDTFAENTSNNMNDSLFPLRHHYLPKTDAQSASLLQKSTASELLNCNTTNGNDVFIFGKPDNPDRGFNFRIMNFFACIGHSLRRLFRIK